MKRLDISSLKKSRWFKPAIWCSAVFVVYVLVGFLVLPLIIKSQLIKRLPEVTKRQAAVRQVKFNPLVLSLTIRGLSLTEPDGKVFASWEELYVNFQLSTIFRLAWSFDEIGLKQPYGHIILNKDGSFNFANMVDETAPPPPEPEESKGITPVHIGRLHIDEGVVEMDDMTHALPLHSEFKPINIALTNLTTRPNRDSLYSIVASSDSGKSFSWSGTVTVDPFQSSGHFELEGGEVGKSTPVVRDFARVEIVDGRLNVRADYSMGVTTNGFDARLTNGVIELVDFKVNEVNSGETVTTVPSLTIKPIEFSLLDRNLHIGEIKLADYAKVVRIEKDGSLNLNLLLESTPDDSATTNAPDATAKSADPWTISVDDVHMANASVAFEDLSHSTPFKTTLQPIEMRVKKFTTRPESDATYQFSIRTETAEVVSGEGSFSSAPVRSAGSVKLEGMEIKKYAPYFKEILLGEVLAGRINAGLDYKFLASTNAPLLTVSNAGVALVEFELKAADSEEKVISIPSFSVEQTEANLEKRTVQVGMIKSSDGSILARQHKDGAINLLGLIAAVPEAAESTNTASAPATDTDEAPWTVVIKEIAFDKYHISLEDQKLAQPARLSFDPFAFQVKNISTVSNTPLEASLSVRINEAGEIRVGGTAKMQPPTADLDLEVKELDLRAFQPYLNEHVLLSLVSGKFSSQSHIRYASPDGGGPMLKYTGSLGLAEFATTDQAFSKEFLKWDALEVTGIDFELQPDKLTVEEINWRGFKTSIVLGTDGRLNLTTLLPEKEAEEDPPPPASPPPSQEGGFPLELGALILENASFQFRDESIQPHCAFDIEEFGGSIRGLSSREDSTAVVDVSGKVNRSAPFFVAGKVNPLSRDLLLDIAVAFTNTDLTPFTPYLEKFAGHPLSKGKLTMAIYYAINNNQLKAENLFQVDALTLGRRNNSPDATSLPVKLAVALVKDRNGRIEVDIPMSGELSDPEFKVLPLILKAVVNLLTKAATSPFSLLGAALGGGEEMSFVVFEPGQAEISEAEGEKLDKLVEALHGRPGLSLEITGSADPSTDGAVLAQASLDQQIKALRVKELTEAGDAAPTADTVQLEPAEYERLLTRLFLKAAQTNQAWLPQTNDLAQATESAATPRPETVAPAQSVKPGEVSSKSRRQYFSVDKGATLLRRRPKVSSTTVSTPASVASSSETTQESKPAVPAAAAAGLTIEDMKVKLISVMPVAGKDFLDLMTQRAKAVESRILESEKVDAERLFIMAPKLGGAAAVEGEEQAPSEGAKQESKVHLSLI